MNDILSPSLIAVLGLVAGGTALGICHVVTKRAARRRAYGYSLIHSLRAYSAWTEYQRNLPFTTESLDEVSSPESLTEARDIAREWFPSLAPLVVQLLQAHDRMIGYLKKKGPSTAEPEAGLSGCSIPAPSRRAGRPDRRIGGPMP